jgi:glutathione S-transferase
MSSNLQLWTWQLSPFAGKVRVVLAEKGLEAELLEIHPAKRPEGLREANPLGRVPVLVVDGTPVRDAVAICELLEDLHPEPALLPADPLERARIRGIVSWLDAGPMADFFLGIRKGAFGLAPGDPEDLVAQLHGRVPRAWRHVERWLGERPGPWLAGEQFTLADVTGMPLAARIPGWGKAELAPDPAEHPLAVAWFEALRERPSAAAIDLAGPEVLTAG